MTSLQSVVLKVRWFPNFARLDIASWLGLFVPLRAVTVTLLTHGYLDGVYHNCLPASAMEHIAALERMVGQKASRHNSRSRHNQEHQQILHWTAAKGEKLVFRKSDL